MTKHISRRGSNKLVVVGVAIAALSGCSEEKTERWMNKKTQQFQGVFENQYNDDLLNFENGEVSFLRAGEPESVKLFEVEDAFVTIKMRNNSMEKREDIIMRIHGDNELLTCASCAKFQLSSVWQKRDFFPSPDTP